MISYNEQAGTNTMTLEHHIRITLVLLFSAAIPHAGTNTITHEELKTAIKTGETAHAKYVGRNVVLSQSDEKSSPLKKCGKNTHSARLTNFHRAEFCFYSSCETLTLKSVFFKTLIPFL